MVDNKADGNNLVGRVVGRVEHNMVEDSNWMVDNKAEDSNWVEGNRVVDKVVGNMLEDRIVVDSRVVDSRVEDSRVEDMVVDRDRELDKVCKQVDTLVYK